MDPSGQQITISIPLRGKKKKNERAPKILKVKTTKKENSKPRQKCPDSSPPRDNRCVQRGRSRLYVRGKTAPEEGTSVCLGRSASKVPHCRVAERSTKVTDNLDGQQIGGASSFVG